MDIKSDARHYYLKGLLNTLRLSAFGSKSDERDCVLYKRYRMPGCEQNEVKVLSQNEVIDVAIDYIAELEAEVEKLQYVARIIEAAKEYENVQY